MKAIETIASLTKNGQLTLDTPLDLSYPSRVRVIILVPDDDESDDDPIETIREGIYEGWQQALTGNYRPIAELWDGV